MCKGSCKLPFRALTLVSADEGSSLYSTLTGVGIVEVEIKEVTRKQMAQCRYRPGSPEWKVVEYLRSMSDLIGYRRLD